MVSSDEENDDTFAEELAGILSQGADAVYDLTQDDPQDDPQYDPQYDRLEEPLEDPQDLTKDKEDEVLGAPNDLDDDSVDEDYVDKRIEQVRSTSRAVGQECEEESQRNRYPGSGTS